MSYTLLNDDSFSFMGHGVLPSVYRGMKHPSSYESVTCSIFIFVTITYLFFSSLGYFTYGGMIEGNIIDNFPLKSDLTLAIAVVTVITVTTKFILATFPVCEGLIEFISGFIGGNRHQQQDIYDNESLSESSGTLVRSRSLRSNSLPTAHRAEYNIGAVGSSPVSEDKVYVSESCLPTSYSLLVGLGIRTLIPVLAMTLAIILPSFIELLSIIGAVFGALISLIIPSLSYLKIYEGELLFAERMILYVIILMGIILGTSVLMIK